MHISKAFRSAATPAPIKLSHRQYSCLHFFAPYPVFLFYRFSLFLVCMG